MAIEVGDRLFDNYYGSFELVVMTPPATIRGETTFWATCATKRGSIKTVRYLLTENTAYTPRLSQAPQYHNVVRLPENVEWTIYYLFNLAEKMSKEYPDLFHEWASLPMVFPEDASSTSGTE